MINTPKHQHSPTLLKPAFIVGFFLIAFLFFAPPTHAATNVSGTIFEDTEWTVADSPYVLYNTMVASGVTLTIDPGVVVKFAGNASLTVNGSIHADGTATDSVHFTSIKDDMAGGDTNGDGTATAPAPGDWDGILLGWNGTAGENRFLYTDINYGGGSCWGCHLAGIYVIGNGNTLISNAHIHNSGEFGVYENQGTGSVITINSEFDNTIIGYELNYGVAAISNSNFHDNAGPAVMATQSTLSLNNNQFSNNSQGSVNVTADVNFTHTGNSESGSGKRGIAIYGTMVTDQTWGNDLACVVNGDLNIPVGITLTIDAGTVIKYANPGVAIKVMGTLIANGTAADPVYFTSIKDDAAGGDTNGDGNNTAPAAGDGGEIMFGYGGIGGNSVLNHAILRYGGGGLDWSGGCGQCRETSVFVGSSNVTINNSQITDSPYLDIYQSSGGNSLTLTSSEIGRAPVGYQIDSGTAAISDSNIHDNTGTGVVATAGTLSLNNNQFSNNAQGSVNVTAGVNFTHSENRESGTGQRGITFYGTLTSDQTWTNDMVYVINGVTVPGGITLTLDHGTVVKYHDASDVIRVSGSFVANGMTNDPVYITSIKDDTAGGDTNGDGSATAPAPGDGGVILFGWGGSFADSALNYSIIRYGGGGGNYNCSYCYRSNVFVGSGNLAINNSQISDSNMFGIYQSSGSGTLTIASSELDHNVFGYGLAYGAVSVTGTGFHDNSSGGFLNSNAGQVDVRNNWWGSNSGPNVAATNPTGTGDKIYGNVTYTPWLTVAPPDPFAPDTRQLIKVAVVLMDTNNVDHLSSSITARPCKLDETPEKTYQTGHSEEYYNDIITCVKDYYRENFFDTIKFDFTFIGGDHWFRSSGDENTYLSGAGSRNLMNEALSVNGLDSTQYDIVLAVHSGTSSQPSGRKDKIVTQTFRGQPRTQAILLSEDDLLDGWVHEIGHTLGVLTVPGNNALFPDLYKMGNIDQWDVMANGSENGNRNEPPNMSSYSKEYFGLLKEDIHPISDYGSHWINSLESSQKGDTVFRYNLEDNPSADTQRYYLIEARNKNLGTWDKSLPTTLLKSEDTVLYYVNTKGNQAYGYCKLDSCFGAINNELRRITIPETASIIPFLNNNGVLAINDVYRDLDDFVKFSPTAERTVDTKYAMQVDIQPIDQTAFKEKFMGAVLRPGQLLWGKLFGKISPDSYYFDQKTGKRIWNVYNEPPIWNKIFGSLEYYSSLLYIVLLFVICVGLLAWLFKKIFLKHIKSERFNKAFRSYYKWLSLFAKISLFTMIVLVVSIWAYSNIVNVYDPAYESSGETADAVLPDLDLHAYCPGGKHIGMNYITGEFENQVPDSIVSGSNNGASQWIYVPASVTGCKYFVSSERNQQYLNDNPDIAASIADKSDSYELYARYIDPANGIFTSSVQTDQVIQPGVMMEHDISGTNDISVTSGVVSNPNQHPVADDQSTSVAEETLSPIVLSAVDPEGSPVSYSITGLPTNGILYNGVTPLSGCSVMAPCSLASNTVNFLGNVAFVGTDGFTFAASDGSLTSNQAAVTVEVVAILDTTQALNAVQILPSGKGVLVGNNGISSRWLNNVGWTPMATPMTDNINGVSMVSDSFGFEVGDKGQILQWNGTAWSSVVSPTTKKLNAVSMISVTDGFAIGAGGTIIRWNGTAWNTIVSPTNKALNGVWMISPTNGFAVGDKGTIIGWNGTTWSAQVSTTNANLNGVYALSSTDAFAVGASGTILRWNGTAWSAMASTVNSALNGIYTIDDNNIFAVGASGTIVQWDGTAWNELPSPTERNLNGIWMISANDGFIVGNAGEILRWDAEGWTDDLSQTDTRLNSADIVSSTAAFAVGRRGTLLNWDGATWDAETSPTGRSLNGVSMLSATDGFAVGDNGTAVRWDGTNWNALTAPTKKALMAVSMLSSSDGAAVGANGTILRWNGTAWSSITSPTTNMLRAVSMRTATDGMAVGNNGTVLRWNGTSWTTMNSGTTETLYGVKMVAANNAWVIGANGTIIHWNGTAWSAVSSPLAGNLFAITMLTSTDGYIAGAGGKIIHWNGIYWATVSSPTKCALYGVYMLDSSNGFAVGGQGTVVKRSSGNGWVGS